MKESTSVRLKKIMDKRNLKQSEVLEMAQPYCSKLNVTLKKNDLSQYISGRTTPGQEKLTVLSLALDVNEPWLLGYDVPMTKTPNAKFIKNEFYYKFFPVSISAGSLENIEGIEEFDLINISDAIMGKYAGRDNVVLLKVNGDSMNKIIPDNSFIVVDTSKNSAEDLKDRDIVVFSCDGQYSVKRYIHDVNNQRFIFRPESTEDVFTDIVVSYEEASELKIIGKVVKYIVNL